ncbi:LOW QUALITY PROTEIN: 2-aminoethanethiol dioxygenase-like [Amphiura filiformis]|uniref:LOW QUALITY PROTEIN: 2-aminoethanethiol dioxygenase-like n=1 Tax=Amphiura filiformis TaxID=82378 RepID=UPI003B2259D2
MTSGNLQRVASQAWELFSMFRSGRIDGSRFAQNLNLLRDNVSKISAADLNIDTKNLPNYAPWAAPSGYMDICEDSFMTMGVFTLRKTGMNIPLHDHPGMHGILKVVYGQVRIRSYSYAERIGQPGQTPPAVPQFAGLASQPSAESLTPTRLASDSVHNSESGAILLTPEIGNIHAIEAVDGPAAFLDVLSPPYDPPERDCQYYHELPVNGDAAANQKDQITWLLRIPQPKEFHCELEDYPGPDIQIGST